MARTPVVFEVPGKAEAWEKNNWRKTADAINATVASENNSTSATGVIATGASKVLVSGTDKIPGYLGDKIKGGTGITITESLTGGKGSRILTLSSSAVSTHTALTDMPDTLGTNTGHDERYRVVQQAAQPTSNADFWLDTDATFGTPFIIGDGEAGVDFELKFDGQTNDGSITWMEDEDYFQFADAVRFPAGTTALAPVMFQSGTLLTTPIAGAMEFDGTGIYLTPTNHRRFISLASDSIIATTTATTVASTTLWTGITNANELKPYRVYVVKGVGLTNNHDAAGIVTVTLNLGSTTILTISSPGSKMTNSVWFFEAIFTIRTIGAAGAVSSFGHMEISSSTINAATESSAVDTTGANDVTIKATWSAADADNWLKLTQCWLSTQD
jgi:hypothetical protein